MRSPSITGTQPENTSNQLGRKFRSWYCESPSGDAGRRAAVECLGLYLIFQATEGKEKPVVSGASKLKEI